MYSSKENKKIALWCNGNTSGFGSEVGGSNPSGATIMPIRLKIRIVIYNDNENVILR